MPQNQPSLGRLALLLGVPAAGLAVAAAAIGVSSSNAAAEGPLGLLVPHPAAAAAHVDTVDGTSAHVSGGSSLTLHGSGLTGVRSLVIGARHITPATRTGTIARFRLPATKDFAPARIRYHVLGSHGAVLSSGTISYRVTGGLDRELRYVLRYWKHYNPAYEALGDDDCVDFTSQALLQRGWKQQGTWTHAADVLDSGAAWRSSTALRDFVLAHPSRAVPLTDAQRSRVRLGDIVQFDWDRSGDRDHTGVVTRIVRSGGRIRIFFAGHTKDSAYRSVDTAITKDHPGGRAYYLSVR